LVLPGAALGATTDGPRTFTSTDGRTVVAELVRVEGETATLKLGNGKLANVTLDSLSEADREFAAAWQEEEKSRLPLSALRTTIERAEKVDNLRGERAPDGMREWKRKLTNTTYTVHLANGTTGPIDGVELRYTTYQILNERGGRSQLVEIDQRTVDVGTVAAKETYQHETRTYTAEDLIAIPEDEELDEVRKSEKTFGLIAEVWIGGRRHSSTPFPDNVATYIADYRRRQDEAAAEEARRKAGLGGEAE
jgi:hypothetical protein